MLLFYERSAYFYSQLLEVKVMAAHPIEVFCCRNVDCPDFRIRVVPYVDLTYATTRTFYNSVSYKK
ncbi:hypothetical protein CCP3SC1_200021 [Gammaproteobacteria bacterium]